jgi:hypothetical protein
MHGIQTRDCTIRAHKVLAVTASTPERVCHAIVVISP